MRNDDTGGTPLVREPGFTTIPNAILEALCRGTFSTRERRTILAVCRLTFGHQWEGRRMGAALVASVTGIEVRNTRRILRQLEGRNVVARIDPRPGHRAEIRIVKDPSQWQLEPTRAPRRPGLPVDPTPRAPRRPAAKESSKERRERRAAAPPSPQGDLFGPAEEEAWRNMVDAIASYGVRCRAKLDSFHGLARARMAEHPERGAKVLAQAAHGYIAMDLALGGDERKRWAFLTPRTLLKRGNAATYLEHFDRALDEGKTPPFGRPDPRRARIAEERRSSEERAEQAERDVEAAAHDVLGALWGQEFRALLRKQAFRSIDPGEESRLVAMELELAREVDAQRARRK